MTGEVLSIGVTFNSCNSLSKVTGRRYDTLSSSLFYLTPIVGG